MNPSLPGLATMLGAATDIAATNALHASDRLNRVCSYLSAGQLSKETLDARLPTQFHTVITQSGMLGESMAFVSPYLLTALTEQSGQLAWALVRNAQFPAIVSDQLIRAGGNGYFGRALGWAAERILSTETVQKWARDAPVGPQATLVATMTATAIAAPGRALALTDLPSLKNLTDTLPFAEVDRLMHPLSNAATPLTNAIGRMANAMTPMANVAMPLSNPVTSFSDAMPSMASAGTSLSNPLPPLADVTTSLASAGTPLSNPLPPLADVATSLASVVPPLSNPLPPLADVATSLASAVTPLSNPLAPLADVATSRSNFLQPMSAFAPFGKVTKGTLLSQRPTPREER